jgi:esterase/lipase superfamily enzyme
MKSLCWRIRWGVSLLEALRAIHSRRFGDKVKNVLLVAPDVAVNDFKTEIQQLGRGRALKLFRTIAGEKRR